MSQFTGPITPTNRNGRLVFTTGEHRLGTNPAAVAVTAVNPRAAGKQLHCGRVLRPGQHPNRGVQDRAPQGLRFPVARATCPAGTVGVGGGYASGSAPHNLEYLTSLRMVSSTQLGVEMGNLSNTATNVTALVYCRARDRARRVRQDGERRRTQTRLRRGHLPRNDQTRVGQGWRRRFRPETPRQLLRGHPVELVCADRKPMEGHRVQHLRRRPATSPRPPIAASDGAAA